MTVRHDDGKSLTGPMGEWEPFDKERVEKDIAQRKEEKVRVFHIGPVYQHSLLFVSSLG